MKRSADGTEGGGSAKKARSGPSFLPPQGDLNDVVNPSGGLAPRPGSATAEEIARKRAEIAAKFAAMKNPAARPAIPSVVPAPPPSLPPEPAAGLDPDLTRKVAEARKKVMAMAEKAKNPYLTGPAASTPASAGPSSAGIHPLLMAQETTATPYNRYKPMVPKFATVKANFKQTPQPAPRYESPAAAAADAEDKRKNPYFDARLGEGAGPRERAHRSMKFNAKGKFIRLGEQARSEARLEELKQRIAESSRKAGLEDEMQTVEKQVRRAPPPEVEWWDEDYLPNKTYDDVLNGEAAKRIRSADSPITIYIQHPIQLPAPGEKNKVELNPLKLTKKEMKKMRRQKRREVQQDKQDRQKMGLLPPPPPKVKLSNMMKVLTSDAVADPTKIEARVRREMLQRRRQHERDNESRKLTDEQRRDKVEVRKEADAAKGIHSAVFKIRYFSNPQHRFKVRKNAEQHGLTGVTIFNPKFALVVVEGGAKGIKAYKHLMLNRIDWTEEPRTRVEGTPGIPAGDEGGAGASTEAEGEPQSLADNTCEMIWEGEARDRAFKTFRPKNCPTDAIARDFLGTRMEGFWDVAKKWGEARAE